MRNGNSLEAIGGLRVPWVNEHVIKDVYDHEGHLRVLLAQPIQYMQDLNCMYGYWAMASIQQLKSCLASIRSGVYDIASLVLSAAEPTTAEPIFRHLLQLHCLARGGTRELTVEGMALANGVNETREAQRSSRHRSTTPLLYYHPMQVCGREGQDTFWNVEAVASRLDKPNTHNEDFRDLCLRRDGYCCVVTGRPPQTFDVCTILCYSQKHLLTLDRGKIGN